MNNASKGRCVTVTPRGMTLGFNHHFRCEPAPRYESFKTQIAIGKSGPVLSGFEGSILRPPKA